MVYNMEMPEKRKMSTERYIEEGKQEVSLCVSNIKTNIT
jgi:hypothetical protein